MSDVNELNDGIDPEMWDEIDVEALKVLRSSPIVDAMLVALKRKMQRDRASWEKGLAEREAAHGSYARGRWDASVSAYADAERALNPVVFVWCESCEMSEEQSIFRSNVVPNSRDIS